MTLQDINAFFGDMDLFLMDLILKGKIANKYRVLDVGCGEGRNGIYFIRNGYDYHGWDKNRSSLRLIEYLSSSLKGSNAQFKECDLLDANESIPFDLIICSRVLHFAESEDHFYAMWRKLVSMLQKGSILYASMDSVIDNDLGEELVNGEYEFPDGKVRFALTKDLYDQIKKGFEEIEPLRTLVHHNERAQSFMALKKV